MKRLVKFWQRSSAERCLYFEALIVLLIIRMAVKLFPLQRVLAYLKRFQTSEFLEKSEVSLSQIVWSIRAVGRYLPGGGNCLVQALTGQFMLVRRGYEAQIQIGVTRENGEFQAHAWVEYQGRTIIGAAGVSQYTPFPSLELTRR